ncbi:Chemotaxis protein methyltransferase CheR [Chondromyces apiculatus DSM 436]|uniref:Chemotaxis protein methyltransferase CheR n=2 Tax=Chondromyces apiculatus TaxID=51 RepID=A0A017TB69_9BACT|nr:Chemotaxis protein methyltransferase CheR [Chondromyces apiculatus DSM 436]
MFPAILRNRVHDTPLRVWVPACGTGERVYALAMDLVESMEKLGVSYPVRIYATDADEQVVAKARAGRYSADSLSEMPPERLRRFFTTSTHGVEIRHTIRDLCVFATHDLAHDAPYTKLDLIDCSALTGPSGEELLARALPRLHHALTASGVLVCDDDTTAPGHTSLFRPLDRKRGVFTKPPSAGRLPEGVSPTFARGRSLPLPQPLNGPTEDRDPRGAIQEAHRILMVRYAPSGVIVGPDQQVLQFLGATGPYLESPPGEPSHHIFEIVRGWLTAALGASLERARESGQCVRIGPISPPEGFALSPVIVEAIPLRAHESDDAAAPPEPYHLVLFEAQKGGEATEPLVAPPPGNDLPEAPAAPDVSPSVRQMAKIRRELQMSRESMQSLIEELTATNEELQASNEELLASNEELQELADTLDTTREELQSTHCEVVVLNQELARKNREINQLSTEIGSVFDTTDQALVLVGADLRVIRFSRAAAEMVGLTAESIGGFLGALSLNLPTAPLERRISDVIDTLEGFEGEVQDHGGRWYGLRVQPCRASGGMLVGALLQLTDLDLLQQSLERALGRIRGEARRPPDASP